MWKEVAIVLAIVAPSAGCQREQSRPAAAPQAVLPTPPGPPSPGPTPWLAMKELCHPPLKVDGATWTEVSDVDGDGRRDFLETTCDDMPSPRRCAMVLCLADDQAALRVAAAWVAPEPELVVGIPGLAPRVFEAFVVSPDLDSPGPRCVRGHRFSWDTDGYLSTGDVRCACESPTMAPLAGCEEPAR